MKLVGYRMITRLVYCVFLFPYFILSESKVSTACFSAQGLRCTEHKLNCTEPLVISITNITFGYREGCNAGVSDCADTTCCKEQTGDCFTPYNQTLLSQLQQTCNRRSTCTRNRYNGLDEVSGYCFNGIYLLHSYSKIEYHCSVLGFTAGAETADGFEEIAIAGGVLGTVVVICMVIIVVLVVYFISVLKILNRRLSELNAESHQNVVQFDSAPSRSKDEPPTVYNSLNTRQQNDGQQQNTTNGQKHSSNDSQHSAIHNEDGQINHHYEHPYDAAPRGTTDQPTVVSVSLNTRL